MSWEVSVISRDIEYNLSDNERFFLTGIDGIAAAPIVRITERGPLQHGESDLGYRLQARRIALVLMARGGDDETWFERRNEILRIFRSSDEPVRLRITRGDVVRQIDCHLSGTMEMAPEVGLAPRWQKVGIEVYAPDPTWYDPTGESITFALGGSEHLLEVPLVVPMRVGASVIDSTIQIIYGGTWDAYPIIILQGPMSSPLIINETMGDKLDFAETEIDAGDSYVVDCRYGYKTVTRTSDGANRIQDLTADSNLATFRIGAHPDVRDGCNSIRVRASGLTTGSTVYIQYYTRYVGV